MIPHLTRMGSILGICFQIRDDIFDYFNNNVGKPTGNDIKEGKITLPLIYALRQAPEPLRKEMTAIIESKEYTDENVERLLQFAKDHGGIDYAYKKMDTLLAEGEEIIANFPFNDEIKSFMRLFLSYLKDRSY